MHNTLEPMPCSTRHQRLSRWEVQSSVQVKRHPVLRTMYEGSKLSKHVQPETKKFSQTLVSRHADYMQQGSRDATERSANLAKTNVKTSLWLCTTGATRRLRCDA